MSISHHRRRIRYSQNFLHNRKLVSRLVRESGLNAGDLVLEIGPGDGAITAELVRTCRHVLAVEADHHQIQRLRKRLGDAPNLTLFAADFLDFPLPETPHKVFASIPYNITAAIVGKLTTGTAPPTEMYLVMQREAAERFLGHPKGTMMAAQLHPWFDTAIAHRFKRTDFHPRPAVDSVLLRIALRPSPAIDWSNRDRYLDLVASVFTAWKPTVREALAALLPRLAMARMHRDLAHVMRPRPSAVSNEEWIALFRALDALGDPVVWKRMDGAQSRLGLRDAKLTRRTRTPAATKR